MARAGRLTLMGLVMGVLVAGCDYIGSKQADKPRSAAEAPKVAGADAAKERETQQRLERLEAEIAREREARQRAEQELAQQREARARPEPEAGGQKAARPEPRPAPPAARGGSSGKAGVEAELHYKQGLTFAAMKDYDNAILEFTRAIEIEPRYPAALANRAVAYMQQGKYNKALDDLKQAETLNPRDKMIHYNYTSLYSLQNQLDRALDSLDRSLALGFADYDALRGDPDLNNLRRHPEFTKVLEKHKVFIR